MKYAVVGVDNPDRKHASMVVTFSDGTPPRLIMRVMPDVDIVRKLNVLDKWFSRNIRELVKQGYEVHCFLESPFVSPKMIKACIPLLRYNGCLLAAAVRSGATTVREVRIQEWKKAVVGNGGAGKPQVAQWVKREWHKVWLEAAGRQDLLDSACINRYGDEIVRRVKYMERPRRRSTLSKKLSRKD